MTPTLQELEVALINANNAGDVAAATAIANDMSKIMQPAQQVQSEYKGMPAITVAERALGNIGSDVGQLAKQTYEAITSPAQTATGVLDLASAGMSKVLDVTGLGKYADPQKMEKYRQIRQVIGQDVQSLLTEEGLKQRIAEKPITSLLDVSVLGQAATAPLKATRYGGALNKGFQTIDPTQIITKPAGAAFEKISDIAQTKTSQYAPTLEKVKSYTESGFVIPPSEVKGAGTIKKGLEYLLGEKTPAKAAIKNQEVVNDKIRSFLDVPENTPLNNAMQIIKDRTKPIYDEVAKIKPILVSKSQTIPQTRTGAMGEIIDMPSKKIAAQKTRGGQQILTDIEKQRAITSKSYRDANNKANSENKAPDYEKAEKSLAKQQKLESELEDLAALSGNKELAAKLKEARTDRAKGHSIENAIDKGDLNANLFAKQNKKRYVTGEGKEIIDFATDYPNLVKKQPKPSILSQVQSLIQPLIVGGGAGLLGGPMGAAAFLGARQITPPLLLSKQLQSRLGTSNFMPTGSGLLKALANQPAVTGATYIPSLLQSADIDLAREY